MTSFKYLRSVVGLLIGGLSFQALASGLVMNDRALRDDLTWLSDRKLIQLNLTTWPLSQKEIHDAILTLRYTQDPVNQQVIRRVQKRLMQMKAPVMLSAYVSNERDMLPQMMSYEHSAEQSFGAGVNMTGDFWDVRLQGNAEGTQTIHDSSHVNPDGSYAALRFAGQWLSFGEIPQWWGPGNDTSLVRSDAARPIVGFMSQREEQDPFSTPMLAWLGRWQYQAFAGQIRQYTRPEQPKLFGGRFTFVPADSLQVGISRVIMWGGKGRPQNFDAFRDALLGRDNTGNQGKDPGDQLGGIDFRLNLARSLDLPVTVYGQVVGDDEAGFLPSHNTWLGGLEGHNEWGDRQVNWYVETADTRSQMKQTGIIYYHYCYHEGLYQQGWPLAAAAGGDATQYSVRMEMVLEDNERLSVRGVSARVNRASQSFNEAWPHNDKILGTEASWMFPVNDDMTFKTGGWVTHSEREGDDKGVMIQLSLYGE